MTPDVDHAKRALRAELRERRQLLSERQRDQTTAGLTAQLDALVAAHGAQSVSCFLSTLTEPDTRQFIVGATARGIRVLLPIMRADGLLDWAVHDSGAEIVEAAMGVPEPVAEVLGPIAVGEVDLMLIPAAAVDRTGMRLGWGRGYFDKTLGSMERRPPVYAVVFDSEFVDEVPSDAHDERVNGVVTPTRTVGLSPQS
ncbi:MAG: 5-formyltetrahydrofolate cyclo-ligase [Microbacterium sp.]|uniref:5-formyltetrahydrofolate cyclo-ligase n=1 Tax=Microbacterium sp. TaxID=51671 RepID=UPI003A8BC564